MESSYNLILRKNKQIQSDNTEYSILCAKNKQIDQLIGYSIFISELEMKRVINNKIDYLIQSINSEIKHNE